MPWLSSFDVDLRVGITSSVVSETTLNGEVEPGGLEGAGDRWRVDVGLILPFLKKDTLFVESDIMKLIDGQQELDKSEIGCRSSKQSWIPITQPHW